MADHVLRDVDGDVGLAVVHADGVADEVGRDGRAPRPSLDRLAGARNLGGLLDFLQQVVVDKETFFDGTGHGTESLGLFLAARRTAVGADGGEGAGALTALARLATLLGLGAPRARGLS